MSYGWLTESALLPQPSKKINVDNSSLVDLSVMLEKEKKKRQGKELMKAPTKKVFVDTNKGVEARNKKDLEASVQEVVNGQARLQEKVKLYEAMMKGTKDKKGQFLVDFEGKKFDNMTSEELEEFEKEKHRFYEEQVKVTKEREENIAGRRGTGEMYGQWNEINSERLKWEEEALKDIRDGVTEEMKEEMRQRVLVRQSYDKIASAQEKEKLVEVLKEQEQEKQVANDIKKKREEIQRLRQEKLKKLSGQGKKEEGKDETNETKETEIKKGE